MKYILNNISFLYYFILTIFNYYLFKYSLIASLFLHILHLSNDLASLTIAIDIPEQLPNPHAPQLSPGSIDSIISTFVLLLLNIASNITINNPNINAINVKYITPFICSSY